MMPFSLAAQSSYEERDPRHLLEIILEKYRDISQQLDTQRSPLTSKSATSLSQRPAMVFNTSATYGGHVTNVAGDQNVYGLDGDRQAINLTLDKLVYAEGASWDPTMTCLPGTRATVLSVIHAWARSLDGQNVFWLKGVAGSGKSAIAHTIAQSLHKDGRLASSFFFNRSFAARSTSQPLFTTIARDIAARYPAIAADICATLEDDPSLASAPLSRQFEECILGPLRRHSTGHSGSLVIVIDALDETISDEDPDIELLRILRAEAYKLPPQVRILVTSRPTRDVVDYLAGRDHIMSHPIDVDSVESGQDIGAYIDDQLRDGILCQRMGTPGLDKVLIGELKKIGGRTVHMDSNRLSVSSKCG
ncbi:hypothetical protein FIBSPDRAFT_833772 [Athelia psychrophila]|uniref:NACHT domain-containing protein n=1 Tax=Athelia psychrophila TaxID=1759441 RepID=A0A166DGZ9_9AGAM|nr:hypothetical protein FIBSPDRAFT_833772 [Fibularhizoctonia sp. CBS 109695]